MDDDLDLVLAGDAESLEEGMRLVQELEEERERVTAWQKAWPEDAPLSEAELREELKTVHGALKLIIRRMKDLYDRLPDPGYLEKIDTDEVPGSIYVELLSTVGWVRDELPDIEGVVRDSLEETPESLWDSWATRISSHRPDPY